MLNKSMPIPFYFQLEKLLLDEIEKGTYPVDTAIPTEKELSELFGISRTTVRQAVNDLVREGRLYRIKSKGTFVKKAKLNQGVAQNIQSFNDDVIRAGGTPRTEILDFRVVKAPSKIALELDFEPSGLAVFLHRKLYADSLPILCVETYLSYDRCGFTLSHDFASESLYEVLSVTQETCVTHVNRSCEAHLANAGDVSILDVKRSSPILYVLTKGFNKREELVEYSVARYRGDYSTFSVDLYW